MTPEKRVQSAICDYLSELENAGYPLYHERRQAGGYSYKMGIPDLYAVFNGQHIEIEVKKPGGERSSMQYKWERKAKSYGMLYVCAESVDDVKILFKDHFNVV